MPAGVVADYGEFVQVPLMGQALVMVHNVPTLAGHTLVRRHRDTIGLVSVRVPSHGRCPDRVQVLDRDTLARIWAGNVTTWNDSAIRASNAPQVASLLPAETIVIGYPDDQNRTLGISGILKTSLARFSSEFAAELQAANGSFADLPPAVQGNMVAAGQYAVDRLNWLQVGASPVPLPRDDCRC